MGIGAQNHVAAGRQGFACILVDNRLVGRNIDPAILLGGGKAEHMVVLVDGTAHGAQGIVAIGHGIRKRELLQAAGAGRLDNAHIGNVMGHHGIEADAHRCLVGAGHDVMCTQNLVSNGVLTGLVLVQTGLRSDGLAIEKINSIRMKCNHDKSVSISIVNASISAAPPGEIPSAAYRLHISVNLSLLF